MLDLYTWPTPNGHKVHIMLEELGADYRVVPIDIWAGEQFSPDFLRISPNLRWSTTTARTASLFPSSSPEPSCSILRRSAAGSCRKTRAGAGRSCSG